VCRALRLCAGPHTGCLSEGARGMVHRIDDKDEIAEHSRVLSARMTREFQFVALDAEQSVCTPRPEPDWEQVASFCAKGRRDLTQTFFGLTTVIEI
jgi:hypothetical protein